MIFNVKKIKSIRDKILSNMSNTHSTFNCREKEIEKKRNRILNSGSLRGSGDSFAVQRIISCSRSVYYPSMFKALSDFFAHRSFEFYHAGFNESP